MSVIFMKRNILSIIALGASLAAMADVTASYPVTTYNFGAFSEESGPVSCKFPVVNTGSEPLSILSARATCGCTQPSYPHEAIAPGDTAYIDVTYDPQYRPGRFHKQVYIETNAAVPKARFDIEGVVIGAPRTISQRYPADFGNLKMEHPAMMLGDVLTSEFKTAYFNGYNQSADSLVIKAERTPDYLQIMPSPEVALPGEQMAIVVFIDGNKCKEYGLIEDSVEISITPGNRYTIPFTLIVNEDFSKLTPEQVEKAPVATLSGESVDFGTVARKGAPVTRTFTLKNTGKETLEVRRIYSADPGVTVAYPDRKVKSGQQMEITATVDPAQQKGGILNSKVMVISNDPMHPTQTVRLVGEWK